MSGEWVKLYHPETHGVSLIPDDALGIEHHEGRGWEVVDRGPLDELRDRPIPAPEPEKPSSKATKAATKEKE